MARANKRPMLCRSPCQASPCASRPPCARPPTGRLQGAWQKKKTHHFQCHYRTLHRVPTCWGSGPRTALARDSFWQGRHPRPSGLQRHLWIDQLRLNFARFTDLSGETEKTTAVIGCIWNKEERKNQQKIKCPTNGCWDLCFSCFLVLLLV